jgi:uncharacterized protein
MTKNTAKSVASIVASAGELVGRTRLQKIGSLLELTGLGAGFRYEYYLFGPYSDDFADAVNRAAALGYIREEVKRSARRGEYSVFRAEHVPSELPAKDQIVQIAKDADAIDLELAATAAFLASQGESKPWAEVVARKRDKAEHVGTAKALYRRLSAVNVPRPLPPIV